MFLWVTVGTLFAANPAAFATLGDPIFNAVPQIEQLGRTKVFQAQHEKIKFFLEECEDVKARGFALEQAEKDPQQIKRYLNKLRQLDTEYKQLQHGVQTALKRSIETNDYEGFVELIETDMIDIEKHASLILPFYETHKERQKIESIESYLAYLEEANALEEQERAEKDAEKQELYQSYRQHRLEDVNRRQAAKKAAYRKAVEAEMERQKEQVHTTQKTELGIQN